MKEYKYTINGNKYEISIEGIEDNIAKVLVNGEEYKVEMEKEPEPEKKARYQQIRDMIEAIPKFGNDIPEVDAFARDVACSCRLAANILAAIVKSIIKNSKFAVTKISGTSYLLTIERTFLIFKSIRI